MEPKEQHYDAFISYRHSPLDQKIASALHRKLENYTLPRALAKKLGRKKLERVFRDTAELSVSSELSESINQALIHSDFLIVICSPRLPESEWCMKEVETFLKLKGREHILLVLIEGEPKDSFPEILCYEDVVRTTDKGEEITIREKHEPLAAQCRGNTGRELRNALNDASLRLCAAIFGINYDDLRQRQREAEIRRRALVISAAFFILLLIIVQNTYFLLRLQKQNSVIEEKLADATASASGDLLSEGRTLDALYLARAVLPENPDAGYNASAFRALVDATGIYSLPTSYQTRKILKFPASVLDVFFSADGKYAIGRDYNNLGKLYLMDLSSSSVIFTFDGSEYYLSNFSFDSSNGILFSDYEKTYYYDYASGSIRELLPISGQFCSSEENNMTLISTENTYYAFADGKILYRKNYDSFAPAKADENTDYTELLNSSHLADTYLSSDGCYAVACFRVFDGEDSYYSFISGIDARSGKNLFSLGESADIVNVYFDGEFIYILENTYENGITKSIIRKTDIHTNRDIASASFEGDYFYGLYYCNDNLMVYNNSRLVLLDNKMNILRSIGMDNTTVTPFIIDDSPAFFLNNGKLNIWDSYNGYFNEISAFSRKDGSLLNCTYNNGIIYIHKMNSDYVTVYEKYASSGMVRPAEPDINDEDEYIYDESYETDYTEAAKKKAYLYSLIYPDSEYNESIPVIESDDQKFFVIQGSDGEIQIFDKENLNCLFSTFSIEGDLTGFFCLESDNVYILGDSLGINIFTPDFKYITRIPNVISDGADKKTGHLRVYDYENEYEIRIATYGEVMKAADEMLKDYRPNDKILERYGLK